MEQASVDLDELVGFWTLLDWPRTNCGSQRFLVLWHVHNVTVIAAWLDDTGAAQSAVTGSSGSFDIDSCQTPAFQAIASSGGIADISVDVQQYVTAG